MNKIPIFTAHSFYVPIQEELFCSLLFNASQWWLDADGGKSGDFFLIKIHNFFPTVAGLSQYCSCLPLSLFHSLKFVLAQTFFICILWSAHAASAKVLKTELNLNNLNLNQLKQMLQLLLFMQCKKGHLSGFFSSLRDNFMFSFISFNDANTEIKLHFLEQFRKLKRNSLHSADTLG